jgi:hypothetical protein
MAARQARRSGQLSAFSGQEIGKARASVPDKNRGGVKNKGGMDFADCYCAVYAWEQRSKGGVYHDQVQ